MAVQVSMAQMHNPLNNGPVNNFCDQHPSKPVTFLCETCAYKDICSRCTETTHLDHSYIDFQDFTHKRRDELHEITNQTKTRLATLKSEIDVVEEIRRENTDFLVDTVEQIRQRGEHLKQQVDAITNNLVFEAERTYKRNKRKLDTTEEDIKEQMKQLRAFIRRCDMAHTSIPEKHQIEDIRAIFQAFQHQLKPKLPKLNDLNFVRGSLDLTADPMSFGSLNNEEPSHDTDSIRSSSTSEASNATKGSTVLKLIPLKIFVHRGKPISSLTTLPDKKAWVGCGGKKLNLVTREGSIVQCLKLDAEINGSSTSEDGVITAVCCNDRTIREISANGKPVVRFRTSEKPLDLCITPEIEVVVGFESVVRKYAIDGTVICEIQTKDVVNRVSVNSSSGDIAVAMASCLHILDRNLNTKIDINKQTIDNCKFFHPGDVCYDTNQNLLVMDYFTESLMLFDGLNGQYMGKKKPGQVSANCISLQRGDFLWFGGKSGKIKIVQLHA